MFDVLVTDQLWTILLVSLTFSIILMALVQKMKSLSFIKRPWQIWFINLLCSFGVGIPFAIFFYEFTMEEAIWVGLFGFIGAPSLYEALKNQNIITYKPKSLKNYVSISKENEIKRGD